MQHPTNLAHQQYTSLISHEQQSTRAEALLEFYNNLPPHQKAYVDALNEQIRVELMTRRAQQTEMRQTTAMWGILSTLELLLETWKFTDSREIRK